MSKTKRKSYWPPEPVVTSFERAVEEARLAYLAAVEGRVYKRLAAAASAQGTALLPTEIPEDLASRRKPRVYSSPNVQKQEGAFYDLEFCLWLQHNFDYLLAHHQEFPGFKLWQGGD